MMRHVSIRAAQRNIACIILAAIALSPIGAHLASAQAPAATGAPAAAQPGTPPSIPLGLLPGIGGGGRSSNVNSWKPEDYQSARKERDPMLIPAIAALGPGRASSDKAAKLLIELLQAPPGTARVEINAPQEDAAGGLLPPEQFGAPAAPPPGFPGAPDGAPPGVPGAPPNGPEGPGGRFGPPPGAPDQPPGGAPPGDPAAVQQPNVQVGENGAQLQLPPGAVLPPGMKLPPGLTVVNAGPPPEDAVVRAIIESLGANRTDTARAGLKKLLMGEIKTAVSDGAVSGWAAKAILQKPSKEEQDLLVAAMSNPRMLRKSGSVDPSLAAHLVAGFDAAASPELRIALADSVLRRGVPTEQRQAVIAAVSRPNPANLSAQARLVESDRVDESVRSGLEHQFLIYSATAIDRLLGLQAGGLPEALKRAGSTDSDTDALLPVIEYLWTDSLADRLETDARKKDKIVKDKAKETKKAAKGAPVNDDHNEPLGFADFMPLMASLPAKKARSAVYELLKDNWSEELPDFKLGEPFGSAAHDPAILLIAKRMPRQEKPPEKDDDKAPKRAKNYGRKRLRADAKARAEREKEAHYDWMNATEELVKMFNTRFMQASTEGAGQHHMVGGGAQAGLATATSAQPLPPNPAEEAKLSVATRAGRFPIKLHPGAAITAEYHVCWPDDLPKKLRAVAPPLSVHYVRTEDTASMSKLNSHYFAQLKGANSRSRPYGRWLDWMGQGVELGQARTVDVMLSRSGGPVTEEDDSGRKVYDAPTPMVVEILVIEFPEFRSAEDEKPAPVKR